MPSRSIGAVRRWRGILRRSPTARVLAVLTAYVALAALGEVGSLDGQDLWHPAAGLGVAAVAVAGRSVVPTVMVAHLLGSIAVGDAIGRDVYLTILEAVLVGGAYGAVGLVLRDRPSRALSRPLDVIVLMGVLVVGAAPAALAGAAVDHMQGSTGADPVGATLAWFQADAIGMLALVPVALALAGSAFGLGVAGDGRRFEGALERADDVVVFVSLAGVPEWWNEAAAPFFATSPRGPARSIDDAVLGGADRVRRLVRHVAEGRTWTGDEVLVAPDGHEMPVSLSAVPDEVDGEVTGYVVLARARREPEGAGPAEPLHDELTGMPARPLLEDRITHAGERLGGSSLQSLVLLLDIDRFSVVNDSLGRSAGDRLLREVATRLRARLRDDDTLGRLHGDRFAMVVEDLDGITAVMRTADDVLECLRPPFELDGATVVVSASIGIVRIDRSESPGELLRRSELAVHRAKAQGGSRWVMYDDRLARSADRRLRVESWVRRTVLDGTVPLLFEPVVDLATGETPFARALLQGDPELESIPASEVALVAAAAGLAGDLARGVVLGAAEAATRWPAPMGVAVPLSQEQIGHGHIPAVVTETLERVGLAADRLVVSFTEDAYLLDPEGVQALVEHCRDRGVRVALEFGTGSSALSTLHALPVDILVLDRSLLDDLGDSPRARAVVGAVLGIAEVLELTVVAAGVESEHDLEVARSLGCHLGHGARLSPPLPADAMAPWSAGRT